MDGASGGNGVDAAAARRPQPPQAQAQPHHGPAAASTSGRAECYVIVYNVSKKHNVGTLLRSCAAFGVTQARGRVRAGAAAHAAHPR